MMTSSATNGCTPVTITFYNQTNVPLSQTTWTFSDGSSVVVNGSDSVTHVFEGAGSYSVTMDVVTAAGCLATMTYPNYVDVYALPEANFNYAPIPATIYDTEVKFTNFSSSDVTTWQWMFGAGPNPGSSSSENPTVVYPEGVPGEYPMSLTVTNDNGCTDIMEAQVSIVNDVLIYAPSVFTPDGDELNQVWQIYISGIDIYDFHLVIYNRWGEPVWESYNSGAGWNGTYGPGGLVQDGTYVWRVEAKDSYNDKKYEFRGHVTVLK
jgi:gliding motility-associated-like protein